MARGRPSKKQQILDTARHLFAEQGYQGTSIDLVVQQADVSKPTVYNNFPSKQVLWQTLLEQMVEEITQQRAGISAEDAASGLLKSYQMLAERNDWLAIYRICLGERYKLDDVQLTLFDQLEQQHQQWCRDWLNQQQTDLSEEQLFMLLASCREAIITPKLTGQQLQTDTLNNILKSLLVS